MKGVAILGATGSIGASALAVLEQHPDRFRAVALTVPRTGIGGRRVARVGVDPRTVGRCRELLREQGQSVGDSHECVRGRHRADA